MRNWSVFTVRFGGREIRIHLTFVILLLFLLLVEVNRIPPWENLTPLDAAARETPASSYDGFATEVRGPPLSCADPTR